MQGVTPRRGMSSVPDEPRYPIESVANALRLLLMLRETQSISVQQVSKELGVAPSTAHRLLGMLQHYGFVKQNPETRMYETGHVLAEIGMSALRVAADIRATARPALERLVAEIDETAHLAVMRGTRVLFLDVVESSKSLRAGARVGESLPAHATASGLVLLAALPDDTLHALYPHENLEQVTARTVATRRTLFEELAAIRTQGYAINEGQSEIDVVAVAVAVRDRGGVPRAAITVAAPASRLRANKARRLVPAIRAAAEAVGEALG
jgi:DNA-binding IclR family transcriptional regulator